MKNIESNPINLGNVFIKRVRERHIHFGEKLNKTILDVYINDDSPLEKEKNIYTNTEVRARSQIHIFTRTAIKTIRVFAPNQIDYYDLRRRYFFFASFSRCKYIYKCLTVIWCGVSITSQSNPLRFLLQSLD